MAEERLQKIISQAGVASRRQAEKLMTEGRVTVNGATVTELGSKADLDRDHIKVDGKLIHAPKRQVYIALHKPNNTVTTVTDPQHRATVMDLLRGVKERVYPVGRLDYHSEGLLLLTNDGALALHLTHPRYALAKVYHAQVRGSPSAQTLRQLEGGVLLEGEVRPTAPARAWIVQSDGVAAAWVGMELHEGRNRQVRRMLHAVGHPVLRLLRVGIGPLTLGALEPGALRVLTQEELAALRAPTP